MYYLFCDVLCIFCVYMCTEQLPPGGYPIAVKYIISYSVISERCFDMRVQFVLSRVQGVPGSDLGNVSDNPN